MLLYEYKLRLSRAQQTAIDEAIHTTQFIRNKCLRLWMDGRGVSANDLQMLCARLAHDSPFAAHLTSQPAKPPPQGPGPPSRASPRPAGSGGPARRALPASSATVARSRTSRPGGSWTWAGKRLTLTDGGGS